MSKVVPLKPDMAIPSVILTDALENLDQIEGIVLLVLRKDSHAAASWSEMKRSDLAFLARLFNIAVDEAMNDDADS